MKVAICDDEKNQRTKLHEFLQESKYRSDISEIEEFESGEALLRKYKDGTNYEIIILDIKMGGITGIKTAEEIRKMDSRVLIIFITSLAEYALKGYSVRAFNYIIKPIGKNRFLEIFAEAAREVECKLEKRIQFKLSKFNFINIELDKIFFLESFGRKLVINYNQDQLEYYGKISDEETRLNTYGFARIQKSYLINLRHIERVHEGEITLSNGNRLPLGSNYREKFLEQYLDYYKEKRHEPFGDAVNSYTG